MKSHNRKNVKKDQSTLILSSIPILVRFFVIFGFMYSLLVAKFRVEKFTWYGLRTDKMHWNRELRSGAKKVSKFRRKFYLVKSCSIWFKLWHFLNKVFGKNMWKFQQNQTTFYEIIFCSENYCWNLWLSFFLPHNFSKRYQNC